MSAAEFEKLDYRVMGQAYASQNELGRLCDECAYHSDLKARLLANGFQSVLTEVPITVTHRDFSKQYFLDLIADNALYELKTDANLVGEHESQLFNYMFLVGIPRAKLLNFRPPKLHGKIIATSLTQETRRDLKALTKRWQDLTTACITLRETMCDLLDDWGGFLEINLYQEALTHLLGGASKVEQRVSLRRNLIDLGGQRMFLHAPGVAFRVTAFTENQNHLESHLSRLLRVTELKAIQWINLNHAQIEFTTITKSSRE
ncbi:MAG TPA: GxxExxY protein [Verrucomicrobiae bacterium]|nr:GxxExxY protein [Verrucomicrobiae bacterium]